MVSFLIPGAPAKRPGTVNLDKCRELFNPTTEISCILEAAGPASL